ncbi:rhomboid-like protein [Streptomyces albireticuli]|uniref:rhomboid-like protein n=1 Tax=Streptomyces albireticuli TaxID=1940 RepID=UPI0030B8701D
MDPPRAPAPGAREPGRARRLRWAPRRAGRCSRPWRLLPTPTGTPFSFVYGLILLATALYTEFGDEATVDQLLRDSSTDAANLADRPLVVLVASALWVAGGFYSAYGVLFAFVVSALERRVGAARTAGVFLLGHVLATLATELPVAGAVAAGRLPEASLHRLDYGISFGVMACIGALGVLLSRRAAWAVVGPAALACAQDLVELADPLASWGHPIALLTGMACRPLLRDGRETGREGQEVPEPAGRSADGAVPGPLHAPAVPGQRAPAGGPPKGLRGGVPGQRVVRELREQPGEDGRAELVGQPPPDPEAAREVVGVHQGLDQPHGGEAGRVGVAPGVPGAVPGVRAPDGGRQQRRGDADALQTGR